jgi:hypothetical protein
VEHAETHPDVLLGTISQQQDQLDAAQFVLPPFAE